MLNAYRGTVDDEGEGPEEAAAEVDRLFAGAYGSPDLTASEVIERENELVAATLITHYRQLPRVAFSLTAPPWQRRGLARAGLLRTIARLQADGYGELWLAVTSTNTPAIALYESLGFTTQSF